MVAKTTSLSDSFYMGCKRKEKGRKVKKNNGKQEAEGTGWMSWNKVLVFAKDRSMWRKSAGNLKRNIT